MTARLIAIGLVAGVFSSLFGVGGGIVIVPLLVGLAAFDAHSATATSLGAILVTALAGVILYAARGEVRPGYAVLVGLPAIAGAFFGSSLQARITGRILTLGVSALLVAVGTWLVVS
jgi:uncharacterized membrane protein YfcA